MNDRPSVHRQPDETRSEYVERITSGPRGRDGLTMDERELLWRLSIAGFNLQTFFMRDARPPQACRRRRKVA